MLCRREGKRSFPAWPDRAAIRSRPIEARAASPTSSCASANSRPSSIRVGGAISSCCAASSMIAKTLFRVSRASCAPPLASTRASSSASLISARVPNSRTSSGSPGSASIRSSIMSSRLSASIRSANKNWRSASMSRWILGALTGFRRAGVRRFAASFFIGALGRPNRIAHFTNPAVPSPAATVGDSQDSARP